MTVEDEWTSGEKVEVGATLGEGALHGPLAAATAGIIAALIVWWRTSKRRHVDAE